MTPLLKSVVLGVPRMEEAIERRPDWVGLPAITTMVRLLCRELTRQNENLRFESEHSEEIVEEAPVLGHRW